VTPVLVTKLTRRQRPGVVHRDAAPTLLPEVSSALLAANVTLRADPEALAVLRAAHSGAGYESQIVAATEEDWDTEFLDLEIAVKLVRAVLLRVRVEIMGLIVTSTG
jgi:gamma-glutamyl phosphate reductase